MFTDRFFEIPVKKFNRAELERQESMGIDIEKKLIPSVLKILPSQIESYEPSFDNDEPGEYEENDSFNYVNLTTKSGNSFLVYWSIKEFEQRLNDFDK